MRPLLTFLHCLCVCAAYCWRCRKCDHVIINIIGANADKIPTLDQEWERIQRGDGE